MTRKRVIQARVLQELPDGTVGVYYKVIVDSRSFIPDLVVRTSLWHVVQNVWRMAPRCADAKKLCYCVEHKDCLNLSAQRSPCGITESITCGVCDSTLLKSRLEAMASSLKAIWNGNPKTIWCALCSISLCLKSRCGSNRQLVRINRYSMETDWQTVAICTSCANFIRSKSAVEIARRGITRNSLSF